MTARLLIVSNRLPVKVRIERQQAVTEDTVGGLATGLRRAHRALDGVWIGWPGDTARLDAAQRIELDRSLKEARYHPVHLTASEVQHYYEGFSNGVLWPLFHYMPDRMPLASRDWGAYVTANERFADAVAEVWQPDDIIWVHDYHLLRLPALLRERMPTARVGLFLHIPFPSSDIFRVLPQRQEVLEGMLGADLIAFQTHGDRQNFLTAALRVLGIEADLDRIEHAGRFIQVETHPIGVAFDAFDRADVSNKASSAVSAVRGRSKTALVLGVDRLDYTKGIPRRLLAFERLLELHPRWRGKVRLLQIAVPSREGVAAYRDLRRSVDELVGRVNGDWSTFGWAPIQMLHRGFSEPEVIALYRAADVMLVTPLRDGMNLVAKEFVAARRDEAGVLVLSEFAGAAAELGEALIVNPHDQDALVDALHRALSMSDDERHDRMRALRQRVRGGDVATWAARFIYSLRNLSRPFPPTPLSGAERADVLVSLASAARLVVLLDHDGTLVDLAPVPAAAAPSKAVIGLLGELTRVPNTEVHIVSGRASEVLEHWYGGLDLWLHAEHAATSRAPAGAWSRVRGPNGWRQPVIELMQIFAARTAGAFVEQKAVGVAWHYRLADPEFGSAMARELRHHLRALLASAPAEVIVGSKVVEVRPVGVNKGAVVNLLDHRPGAASFLAIGDDRTDNDMFAALGSSAVTVAVGDHASWARFRVRDVAAVHELIREVAATRRAALRSGTS